MDRSRLFGVELWLVVGFRGKVFNFLVNYLGNENGNSCEDRFRYFRRSIWDIVIVKSVGYFNFSKVWGRVDV